MKLRNVLWILFPVFLSGCKSGPRVSFCVLDAPAKVLRCSDPDKQPFDLELDAANNYGCMSPDDWERLLKDMVQKAPVLKGVKSEIVDRINSHPYMKTQLASFSQKLGEK